MPRKTSRASFHRSFATSNQALNKALASDEVSRNYSSMGVEPIPGTPEDFAKRMEDEIRYWHDVVEKIKFEKLKA